MTDITALHREALSTTGAVITAIRDDQWGAPTPCAGWTVRDLTNHIVAGNLWAAELAAGRTIEEVGDRLDGDVLGADPAAAYRTSAAAAAAAFEAPGALEAPCAVSYGPVPGAVYAGHRFIDVLIHGWDLAVATGGETTLPVELVEACWAEVGPQLDMLQGSGMFGNGASIESDASDSQSRLLAALGRRPVSAG